MKILIVDDQNSVHMFLDKVVDFSSLNLTEVYHAYNGKEALSIIEAHSPHIMVLDIQMPLMDGLEVLKSLQENNLFIRTIILSAYNEFEYARKCIIYGVKDYILKPIDIQEFTQKLSQNVTELESKLELSLENEISRSIVSPNYSSNLFIEYLVSHHVSGFGILCFRAGDSLAVVSTSCIPPVFQYTNNELQIIVYTCDCKNNWLQFIHVLRNSTDFSIGCSLYSNDMKQFSAMIQQTIFALSQGFYMTGVYIFNKSEFCYTLDSLSIQTGNHIQQAFHSGNVEAIKFLINKLFLQFKNLKTAPQLVQDFCYSLLLQLGENFFEGFQNLKGNSFSSEIRYSDSGSLKKTFMRIVLNILCNFEPKDARTDSDVVYHIKSYIDEHFEKDLSLETLSSRFFISKYQISRIFKKEFDVNYSDYILKLRMDHAELLLKTTGYKLYEVSKMAGFEETSYFSNVFKKFYGVSPKDYRYQNQKKEGI